MRFGLRFANAVRESDAPAELYRAAVGRPQALAEYLAAEKKVRREPHSTPVNMFAMDRKRKTGGRRSCGALSGSHCTSTNKGRRIHSGEKGSAGASPSRPVFSLVKMQINMFTAVGRGSYRAAWLLLSGDKK